MLDYNALSALAAVIREGSFEAAARALHVTPSAVSQRIRLLEERIGCALVVREQPCRATPTGQHLCRHVDQVRLLEQQLREAVPGVGGADGARVGVPIAVNADSLATWLTPALAALTLTAPLLIEVAVDDQDHTAEWLRSGAVLAAVSASAHASAGCNSRALGAMRYVAAASPAFVARHFSAGVDGASLAQAPSLLFNARDALQSRWVLAVCGRHVDLPRHVLPSSEAFVTAALAGMGWGMHAQSLIKAHLAAGTLVELVAGTPLDVPLYWHSARAASGLLERLSGAVIAAAAAALLPP
ncbi:LysR family transcriptional regulator ArgP [Massilia sp. DWR3-1-1]|uniref:LysR family transcriptional regulator ArgP n=1 Tax=Massilia sp. DWR3-1-1 TaxID=2804559 RepID=UPI003CF442ED